LKRFKIFIKLVTNRGEKTMKTIERIYPILKFVVILLTVFMVFVGCGEKSMEKRLNFVFILADDLGWNQVGHLGNDFYETSNIDVLAQEGMHFTNAYSSAPVCSPTRAGLMTGRHPARLHLTDYIPGSPYPYAKLTTPQQAPCLPLEEVTIAEKLKSAGYVTGHFGKWHLSTDKEYQLGRPFDPGSQGFDEVFTSVKPSEDTDPDKDAHHAVEITERSIQFLEKNKNQPFFLYVSHHVVHRPIMENAELIAKYEAKSGSDQPEHNPIMGAMIERMDTGIGKILLKLEELNLTDRTVVIFYSDNGGLESLQDQTPLRAGKATIFEGGIRVPLVIRWPGVIKAGSVSDALVCSEDFFPTIMEMAGIQYEKIKLDGFSLLPLLKQTGPLSRETLFWHYPHYHHQGYKPGGAIREGAYKLIEWYEPTLLNEEHQINLYNLSEDIGESRDLAAEMPDLAKELVDKLHNWRKSIEAQEMKINPNYDAQKADWRFENE
jgi:arylsulfatase A-like enzyme